MSTGKAMQDKTILISGSTDGIGRQTALELARMKARIIVHGRSEERCRQTVSFIKEKTANMRVEYICADFSSQAEIKEMAAAIKRNYSRLDVLINNAGIFEAQRKLSVDGLEMTFAVNHLSSFLLTGLLLDLLKSSAPARIITVSSMAHSSNIDFENLQGEKYYSGNLAYGLSKLANILFTFYLAEHLKGSAVTVNCLHPGVISTKLLHAGWGMGGAPLSDGARTSVYLASAPDVNGVSGHYFRDSSISPPAAIASDKAVQKRLWKISEDLCGISYP